MIRLLESFWLIIFLMLKIKVLPANCGDSIIVSFDDGDRIKNILTF